MAKGKNFEQMTNEDDILEVEDEDESWSGTVYTGEGNGLVPQKEKYNVIVTSLYSDLLNDKVDGYFFDIITNGKNNMPGYAHQISPEDRWAIVTYINALRFSRSED